LFKYIISKYGDYTMSKFSKIQLLKGVGHIGAAAFITMMLGCSDSTDKVPPTEAKKVRTAISGLALTGDPSAGRDLPNISDPKAQLGMKLFYTKALGGDFDSACVTCHHPMLGGGDDLSLPIGVDAENHDLLGPGRVHSISGEHHDGGPTVPRNAPTTFNLGLWDKVLFHDGRVESLNGIAGELGGSEIRTPDSAFGVADADAGANLATAQARFPVTSPEEMKNFDNFDGITRAEVRSNLAERLGYYGSPLGGLLGVNHWLEEFQIGFDSLTGTAEELITYNNIAEAIAEYENSQVFIDTPWKAFVDGDDDAINLPAKLGAQIFFNTVENGGADCASCHSGDFFTDEGFHATGTAQIGRGKGDGPNGTDDFGRFRETGDEADMYAFRTPSLLNTSATGPWGHAGSYATLEAVIKQHIDPQGALDEYDFNQIAPNIQAVDMVENTQLAVDKCAENRDAGINSLGVVPLNDAQVGYLVEFVLTLTDPCVEDRSCMSPWIPDGTDANPDAMRLNGVDGDGDYL
jgi:cytochrome c peroxidase